MEHYSATKRSKHRHMLQHSRTSKTLCWMAAICEMPILGFHLFAMSRIGKSTRDSTADYWLPGQGRRGKSEWTQQAWGRFSGRWKHPQTGLRGWLHNSVNLLTFIELYTWKRGDFIVHKLEFNKTVFFFFKVGLVVTLTLLVRDVHPSRKKEPPQRFSSSHLPDDSRNQDVPHPCSSNEHTRMVIQSICQIPQRSLKSKESCPRTANCGYSLLFLEPAMHPMSAAWLRLSLTSWSIHEWKEHISGHIFFKWPLFLKGLTQRVFFCSLRQIMLKLMYYWAFGLDYEFRTRLGSWSGFGETTPDWDVAVSSPLTPIPL